MIRRVIILYRRGGLSLVFGKILRRILILFRYVFDPVLFAKLEMYIMLGYWPNLKDPISFNEKIYFRKLFFPHPLSTLLADKYAVREYVISRTMRADILNEVYYIGRDPEDIKYDRLPNKFIIKATHGSGWSLIIEDKSLLNKEFMVRKCHSWLKEKYSLASGNINETHYDSIIPRIMVEEFIEDSTYGIPIDYKFMCFDGKVWCIQVNVNRFGDHRENFYDTKWNEMPFRLGYPNGKLIPKPEKLDEMILIAEKIAKDLDFCRVDLYCPNDNRIVFGEITLAPTSGLSRFWPREWDYRLGKLWKMST